MENGEKTIDVQETGKKKFVPVLDAKGKRIPNFLKFVGNGVIYYRKRLGKVGIPDIFESTGETTIGRARAASEVILQRHMNRHQGISDTHIYGARKGRTFASVCDEVLRLVTPDKREKTREQHEFYLARLKREFGSFDINRISDTQFKAWVQKERKKGERETYFDFAKAMSLVMNYAYQHKYASHLIRFKSPDKKKVHEDRVYSKEEISALWDAMGNIRGGERLRDQFALSYECMMRLREVLRLRWESVDLATGLLTLTADDVKTGSKTKKGREFVVSERALARLRDRFKARETHLTKSPFVFPSPLDINIPQHDNKTAWASAKKEAGISGRATWHALRHTALTEALCVRKANAVEVSEYAGVSLATIQRVYLHSTAEHTKSVSQLIRVT